MPAVGGVERRRGRHLAGGAEARRHLPLVRDLLQACLERARLRPANASSPASLIARRPCKTLPFEPLHVSHGLIGMLESRD